MLPAEVALVLGALDEVGAEPAVVARAVMRGARRGGLRQDCPPRAGPAFGDLELDGGQRFRGMGGVVAFGAILVPALVFVSGYALVCPLVLTAPLFRVLFVGYWFWGNLIVPAAMPTLTGSLLTPIGSYAASWLVGSPVLYAGVAGPLSFLRPAPTAVSGAASIALLILAGLLPLLAAGVVQARRSMN